VWQGCSACEDPPLDSWMHLFGGPLLSWPIKPRGWGLVFRETGSTIATCSPLRVAASGYRGSCQGCQLPRQLQLQQHLWIDNSVSSSSSQAAVFVHIYTDTCTKNVYIYSCIHKIQDPYSHRRLPAMVWLPPTGKMGKLVTFCVVPFAFLFAGQIKSVCTQDQRKIRGNRGWF